MLKTSVHVNPPVNRLRHIWLCWHSEEPTKHVGCRPHQRPGYTQKHSFTFINHRDSNILKYSNRLCSALQGFTWFFWRSIWRGWCATGRLTAGGAGGGLEERRWRDPEVSWHANQERRRAHRILLSFYLRHKKNGDVTEISHSALKKRSWSHQGCFIKKHNF